MARQNTRIVTTPQSRAQQVRLWNFAYSSIAPSDYSGERYSYALIRNLDLYSVPNTIRLAKALEELTTINDEIRTAQFVKGRLLVLFGYTSGKVYTYDVLANTIKEITPPVTGRCVDTPGILGSAVYGEYLYWFTQNYAHRIKLDNVFDFANKAEWFWRQTNFYEELGGSGYYYHLPDLPTMSEDNYLEFTSPGMKITGVALHFAQLPNGPFYIYIQPQNDKVEPGGNVAEFITEDICQTPFDCGWKKVESLPSTAGWVCVPYEMELKEGVTYRVYLYSEDGSGIVYTDLPNDLQGLNIRFLFEGSREIRPTVEQNGVLYIGDGRFIHQIRDGRFTPVALDLPEGVHVTTLGKYLTALVIGASSPDGSSSIYRWNTWSDTFDFADKVPHERLDAFLHLDNGLLVFARGGYIYEYSGVQAKKLKRINPGSSTLKSWHFATGELKERTLLGILGDTETTGVYSFGSIQAGYPLMILNEYALATNMQPYVVVSTGETFYTVFSDGVQSKVYRLSDKYALEGEIRTRVFDFLDGYQDILSEVHVEYERFDSQKEGIQVVVRNDPNDAWVNAEMGHDDINKQVVGFTRLRYSTYQVGVKLTSDGTSTPVVKKITLRGR